MPKTALSKSLKFQALSDSLTKCKKEKKTTLKEKMKRVAEKVKDMEKVGEKRK